MGIFNFWISEYHAIKGANASLLLTVLVGMILLIIFLGLSIVFPSYAFLLQGLWICVILLMAIVAYQQLKRVRLFV